MAVGLAIAEEVSEGIEREDGGLLSGQRCGRCSRKGHVAAACSFEVYCVICDSHDHVNHKCPVLKMPRPVAHAVGYAVHGLGFITSRVRRFLGPERIRRWQGW
jgi:hypothetical protein